MIKIPKDRKWSQTNSGEVFGSLYSSYNVNFDQEGYLQISPKAVSIFSNSDDADFDLALSIFRFNNAYFLLTKDQPFELSDDLAIAEIASAPTDFNSSSDALSWQDRAYATTTDDLVYWNATTWTTGCKTLTAAVPHPLEVMGNFSGGHLCIGNGNTVLRLSSDHSTIVTLTLNSNYQVTSLKYVNSNLYIGTRTLTGREAKMFVWNGSGTSAQSEYSVGASGIFSLEEYQSSVACITTEGQLLRFNGGGFTVLANLPVYYSNYRWLNNPTNSDKVSRRGLRADGDILYLNIEGTVSFQNSSFYYLENQPSGIWCYDPKVGLYCRHLSTSDPLTTVSVSSMAGNVLTLASAIKAVTGEPILISNVGSLTGITVSTTYYVIKVTGSTIKLASTPADALAGTYITLGGSAGSAAVKVVGYTEYGQKDIYSTGGVFPSAGAIGLVDVGARDIFPEIVSSTILWGVELSTGQHLNCLSTASNIGGFVTNKIWSDQVTDSFQQLFVKYKGINLANDKIIVKSRSSEVFGLPTESVAGTFSTASVVGSASTKLGQVAVGHNINLLTGNGAGQSVSITAINGDEYSFDETLSVASSDASTFNVDNFTKKGTITDQVDVRPISVHSRASWTQLQVELRGKEVAIEELQLQTTTDEPNS